VFVDDKGEEQLVNDASVPVRSTAPAILAPPLRSGQWLVHNGPGNHRSPHWGSVLAWNGRATIPQRFGVDFLGLDANGRAVRGDFRTSANEDWTGFGAEVVAVADGAVVDAHDGISDNAPLVEPPPPATLTPTALYGNYVVLDLGSSVFAHYGHLQRNSVMVRVGQRVRRGDVLAHLGNSGNNNAPALHFHVSDSASFGGSEGLPFVIDSFDLIGETTPERAVTEGPDLDTSTVRAQSLRRQLPLDGMIVRFP
jgi:murein DD-endopeptidase MepM/ murein hydrolase activator NlpD